MERLRIDRTKVEKKDIFEAVEKLKNKEIDEICVSNMFSNEAERMFNLEITEFNGWQCDWWTEQEGLCFSGCAWEGTFSIERCEY